MKKLICVFVLCALLSCMALPIAVSAAGEILWNEDFSTKAENDWIWDEGTTLFFVENGKLEGWDEAHVHQSNFLIDRGAPRVYKECAWKVECAGLEDGGRDAEEHGMSIWFADYISPYGDPENKDGAIVYTCGYNFEKNQFSVSVSFDDAGEQFKPANYPEEGPLFSVAVANAPVMDPSGNSTFTLGMRIANGKAAFYMNDQKMYEIDAYRGTKTATEVGSPILIWNQGLHCTFDNLLVTTPDYDLFNEGDAMNAPVANEGAPATEKVVETETRLVTDTDGNTVVEVVTNEVARPAANTGAATTGGTAARTGDSVVVVIAVMIVALGSAIAVKKFSSK